MIYTGGIVALFGKTQFRHVGYIPVGLRKVQVIDEILLFALGGSTSSFPLLPGATLPCHLLEWLLSHDLASNRSRNVSSQSRLIAHPHAPRSPCRCVGTANLRDDSDEGAGLPEASIFHNGPHIVGASRDGLYVVSTTPERRRWWWWCRHGYGPMGEGSSVGNESLRRLFNPPTTKKSSNKKSGLPDVMAVYASTTTILLGLRDGRVARLLRQYSNANANAELAYDDHPSEEEHDFPIFQGWVQPAKVSETERDPVQHIFPWSRPGQPERVLIAHQSGQTLLWELSNLKKEGAPAAHVRAELSYTYSKPGADELRASGVPVQVAGEYPLVAMLCPDSLVRIWQVDGEALGTTGSVAQVPSLTEPRMVPRPNPPPRAEPLAHPLRRARHTGEDDDAPAPMPLVAATQSPSDGADLRSTHFHPCDVVALTWIPSYAAHFMARHLTDPDNWEDQTSEAGPEVQDGSRALLISCPGTSWVAMV